MMKNNRFVLPRVLLLLALTFFVSACGDDSPSDSGSGPRILDFKVEANPYNVVGAVVRVRVEGTREVVVEYGTDALFGSSVEAVAVQGDTALIPVFGLDAATTYKVRVVARSATNASVTSQPISFTTGAMPADMPKFDVTAGANPASGYVAFGITAGDTALGGFYALIVDNDGKIMWYRRSHNQITDFQQQPNGNFTLFASLAGEVRRFYELDRIGNVVGEYRASGGRETGAHELRLLSNGGQVLFGLEDNVVDLTQFGGVSDAKVRGMVIEYTRPGGGKLIWRTADHLTVDEAMPDIHLTTQNVNPWHCNAIDVDTDGNLLVSFRNSDMIVKIDANTGQILWRLGGEKNQFTFINDPLNGFSHQHGIRRLPNGNIILFDNGNLHTPPLSRGVEYRLDESAKTAELVWEYRHQPMLYSFALGFAHRTASGHTLLCYGTSQRLVEVDAAKMKQWELVLENPAYFIYRAFRIGSMN
jgi:hypothetical protein